MTPLVLTRKEAADLLKVSVWTLDRMIADGRLPAVRFPATQRPGDIRRPRELKNRRVLIAVADLEAFVGRSREVAS